jgi:hypothetical protein
MPCQSRRPGLRYCFLGATVLSISLWTASIASFLLFAEIVRVFRSNEEVHFQVPTSRLWAMLYSMSRYCMPYMSIMCRTITATAAMSDVSGGLFFVRDKKRDRRK